MAKQRKLFDADEEGFRLVPQDGRASGPVGPAKGVQAPLFEMSKPDREHMEKVRAEELRRRAARKKGKAKKGQGSLINPAKKLGSDIAIVTTQVGGSPAFTMLRLESDGTLGLDELRDAAIGWISFEPSWMEFDDGDSRVWQIARAVSVKGYGPRLYEHALHWARDEGATGVTPGDRVSPSASRVWNIFSARPDFHAEEFPFEITYAQNGYEESGERAGHPGEGDWLELMYSPTGDMPKDLAAAVTRGEKLYDSWLNDPYDLLESEIETHVLEAGHAMYDSHVREQADELQRLRASGY